MLCCRSLRLSYLFGTHFHCYDESHRGCTFVAPIPESVAKWGERTRIREHARKPFTFYWVGWESGEIFSCGELVVDGGTPHI